MLDQFAVRIPQEDIINDTKLKSDAKAEDVCLWCNEEDLNNYMDNLYAKRSGHVFLQEDEYVRIQQKDIEDLIQSFISGKIHARPQESGRRPFRCLLQGCQRLHQGESE
jgi:hypothetical protein